MARLKRNYHIDYVFLILSLALLAIGLIILSSVSSVIAFQKFKDPFYYIKHQIFFGVFPGILILIILSSINYQFWKKFAFLALLLSIFLLLSVFVPGLGYKFGGARSWVRLGPILFQPAEIVKLTFLLYLATWLSARDEKTVKDLSAGLIPFLITLGIIIFLIFLQPDVGTMSVIVAASFIVYFIAGASLKHLLSVGILGILILGILISLAPYRVARFTVFLHPELDPKGVGYQINQALLAIGSGGFWGLGLGHSRQKHLYLPEVIGDSVFAVAAEELGFLLSVFLICLYAFFIYRGFLIARRTSDKFAKLVVTGIMSVIAIQTIVNIGGIIGIMPLTGITLPFISYGSSSLVTLLAGIGIVLNISKYS